MYPTAKSPFRLVLGALSFCFLSACAPSDDAFTWVTATPASVGMNEAKLTELREALASKKTRALLIVKGDRIVYEWYAPDHGVSIRHHTASLAKGLVGGISLAVALSDKRLGLDDPAGDYVPAWKRDERKTGITIRHLATHTSGIEDAEVVGRSHDELEGWKASFWRRTPDPFSVAINEAPVLFEPGTRYLYSNPGFAALAYAVTASLRGAPESDIHALLKKRIMDPIGVPARDWSIGYRRAYALNQLTLYANWGGASYTARAAARVGQLLLHNGRWAGRQLIDPQQVKEMVSPSTPVAPERAPGNPRPRPGLGWYANSDGIWPALPRDAFVSTGKNHQVVLVVPSLDLVVVRYGGDLGDRPEDQSWSALEKHLFDPLMEAVVRNPYPASQVIRKITFAPKASVVRKAVGGDNWPLTWGDDDFLYTAYGDGWGFDVNTGRKLSLGFASISGGPSDLQGRNIRSASGERQGAGALGPKASGMLMVDGVLYMWVRNVGNSQLAWSEDRGKTWVWGFRFQESFGCPTFLNFGRNYQGARDEFVYTYSVDGPSCYESCAELVMARVQRTKIRDAGAYEFFQGMDAEQRSMWTEDIHERRPVFAYRGQRADVVYHPGIKRYLLFLGFGLYGGGWGIFEAPEPWGPWSTAFVTENWGLGDTHSYRLPTKWIEPDSDDMYLVFSGKEHEGTDYDAFCVRRLTLDFWPSGAVSF
jgi:CubicO group peptidase (beta-lactamase class C family)